MKSEGGIYLDTDIIPIKPFEELLAEGRPVMGLEKGTVSFYELSFSQFRNTEL